MIPSPTALAHRLTHPILTLIRWLARLGIVALTAAVLVLSLARFIGPERHWWLALAQFLPFHVYWLAVGAALLGSLLLTRWWRVAVGLNILLIATVVMGLQVNRGDTGSKPLRLMTYNAKTNLAVRHPAGMRRLQEEIKRQDPDILVMQDATEMADLPLPLSWNWGKAFGSRQVHFFGQYVVASRFPLRECAPYFPQPYSLGLMYVHCIVQAHDMELDLYTVHLLTPRNGLNAARWQLWAGLPDWQRNVTYRLAQGVLMSQVVARSRRPVIIAGDLNSTQPSVVVQALTSAGVRDAFAAGGRGYGYTYGHDLRPGVSFLRIDHIMVSDSIGVARCFAGGSEGSEHRPVIADLLLQRN